MPPFANPWFWVVLVVMSIWSMYGLMLRDYGARKPEVTGLSKPETFPFYFPRVAVIAVACNLAAAGMGLNAWLIAPTTHLRGLLTLRVLLIVLWVVCVCRVVRAIRLIGKPARRPKDVNMLAFWGYVLLTLVVLMPMAF